MGSLFQNLENLLAVTLFLFEIVLLTAKKGISMYKLNLFKLPIEKDTLDDWAKITTDVAKVAILAIPVILYGDDPTYLKLINTALLYIGVYASLQSGRIIRQYKQKQEAQQ